MLLQFSHTPALAILLHKLYILSREPKNWIKLNHFQRNVVPTGSLAANQSKEESANHGFYLKENWYPRDHLYLKITNTRIYLGLEITASMGSNNTTIRVGEKREEQSTSISSDISGSISLTGLVILKIYRVF